MRGKQKAESRKQKAGVHGLGHFGFQLSAFSFSMAARAATNAAEEIGVPKLAPPYPELPPTFWERYGVTTLALSLAGILIAVLIVRLVRRPKHVEVLPPEVQARRALEALRPQAEDGAALSQISRILRVYLRATFELPPDELTTTEFCRVLANHEKIGAELAAALSDFLRHCDEHKFSARRPEPLNAAARALELVSLSEARRAQSRPEAIQP